MALQFFDDIADETHGAKLAGKCETAKLIRNLRPGTGNSPANEKARFFYPAVAAPRRPNPENNFDLNGKGR